MKWSVEEIKRLAPLLDEVEAELEPLEGKHLLVLCSAGGEMAFRLAAKMRRGRVVGVELDQGLVEAARKSAEEKHFSHLLEFGGTEKTRLSLPDNAFDGLMSEFIVYPSPMPTEVGQPEMARVLKPGGRMVITDVIVPQPVTADIRQDLASIGLDYLCEGTAEDFRAWMQGAGLVDTVVKDLTPVLRALWERRRETDPAPEHRPGYALLLEDSPVRLGKGLFYILVHGTTPKGRMWKK